MIHRREEKALFIRRNWNICAMEIGGVKTWYIVVYYFPSAGKREHLEFAGRTEEECLDKAITAMDDAVRKWAYKPESSPFGRYLAVEKGWTL